MKAAIIQEGAKSNDTFHIIAWQKSVSLLSTTPYKYSKQGTHCQFVFLANETK
jgi:hypothetical protein